MIFCSSHFQPFLLLSHSSSAGSSHVPLFPPTLVCGEAGVGAVTLLSLLLISRLSKSIHILTVFGVGLVLGGGASPGAREGRGSSSLSWLSSGCSPPPPPPGSQLGEKPQHYHSIIVTATNPLAITPFPLRHPDLWL